jgi:hypothetical protein
MLIWYLCPLSILMAVDQTGAIDMWNAVTLPWLMS